MSSTLHEVEQEELLHYGVAQDAEVVVKVEAAEDNHKGK